MTETEKQLNQQLLLLTARLGAMEALARALFVIVAQRDKTPIKTIEEQIIPRIVALVQNRPTQATNPPELDQWLRKKEEAILTENLKAALEALYAATGSVSSSSH